VKRSVFSVIFAVAAVVPLTVFAAEDQTTTSGQTTTTGQTATPPAAGDPSTTSDAPNLDQVECRELSPPTGTRLGARRICQTKRQWLALQADSQKTLNDMQRRGGSPGMVGN
jgi:hypothetical protein